VASSHWPCPCRRRRPWCCPCCCPWCCPRCCRPWCCPCCRRRRPCHCRCRHRRHRRRRRRRRHLHPRRRRPSPPHPRSTPRDGNGCDLSAYPRIKNPLGTVLGTSLYPWIRIRITLHIRGYFLNGYEKLISIPNYPNIR
jgi:hypothetical protein